MSFFWCLYGHSLWTPLRTAALSPAVFGQHALKPYSTLSPTPPPFLSARDQITGARLAECDSVDGTAAFTGVALRGMSGEVYSVGFSGSTAYRDLVPVSSVRDGNLHLWSFHQ